LWSGLDGSQFLVSKLKNSHFVSDNRLSDRMAIPHREGLAHVFGRRKSVHGRLEVQKGVLANYRTASVREHDLDATIICSACEEDGRVLITTTELSSSASGYFPGETPGLAPVSLRLFTMPEDGAKRCFMSSWSYWSNKTLGSAISLISTLLDLESNMRLQTYPESLRSLKEECDGDRRQLRTMRHGTRHAPTVDV
jgi:hypothetical protein